LQPFGKVCARVSEYPVECPKRLPSLSLRLGHAVRRRRETLGLSKTEAALLACIALGTLRSIERGDQRRRPRCVLERLARVLGVDDVRELVVTETLESSGVWPLHPCPSTWPPGAVALDVDALGPIDDVDALEPDAFELVDDAAAA
jgi:transcriptional regulator with XRE-family HTH domain